MDPNTLFQRAGQAFQAGRPEAARTDLKSLLRQLPNAAQAWHMLALAERRLNNATAARDAFERAIKLAPTDAAAFGNYANLLGAEGDHAAAIERYRYAVKLKPDFADAWLNLGVTAHEAGDEATALHALERAHKLAPRNPKAWTALGLLLRDRGDRDAAAQVLDTALKLDPANRRAAEARARVEVERGGPDAVALAARARALAPADRDLALNHAAALATAGHPEPEAPVAELLARDPAWAAGHIAAARLRHERGDPHPTALLESALASRPNDTSLWEARLALASHAAPADVPALAAAARAAVGAHPPFDLFEADAVLADDPEAAFRLAEGQAGTPAALLRARAALRGRDPTRANAELTPVLAGEPVNQLAWALAATAWRLGGDPRLDWLLSHPNLWNRFDLGLAPVELAQIADHLRALHTTRVAPLEQSLRGGTQTTGTLFLRTAPEITRLRRAIESAVDAYLAALPPRIEGHPLLGPARTGWRFTGSWSVRLTDGGLHLAHVHPQGWISSACYLALPAFSANEGALILGVPPTDLRLDLPPLALIEPAPGALALFPSFLWHGTQPFAAGERLTAAFDVVPAGT